MGLTYCTYSYYCILYCTYCTLLYCTYCIPYYILLLHCCVGGEDRPPQAACAAAWVALVACLDCAHVVVIVST